MKAYLRARALAALVLSIAGTPSCTDDASARAAMMTHGDPARGKEELRRYGCGSCHTIPGVPGANALVGPELSHVAKRSYLAGTLPNNPANMREWIMHPQHIKPHNAMPDEGVSESSARDMTVHLYTLE